MCLHDIVTRVKGEEVHVHYEWEVRAFDVLYGSHRAWRDDEPHKQGTITIVCVVAAIWLLRRRLLWAL